MQQHPHVPYPGHQPYVLALCRTAQHSSNQYVPTQCPPPELELTLLRFTGLAFTTGGTFLVGDLEPSLTPTLPLPLTPADADVDAECDLTTSGLTGLTRSSGGEPFMSSVPPRLGGARGGNCGGGGDLLLPSLDPAPLAVRSLMRMLVDPFWSGTRVGAGVAAGGTPGGTRLTTTKSPVELGVSVSCTLDSPEPVPPVPMAPATPALNVDDLFRSGMRGASRKLVDEIVLAAARAGMGGAGFAAETEAEEAPFHGIVVGLAKFEEREEVGTDEGAETTVDEVGVGADLPSKADMAAATDFRSTGDVLSRGLAAVAGAGAGEREGRIGGGRFAGSSSPLDSWGRGGSRGLGRTAYGLIPDGARGAADAGRKMSIVKSIRRDKEQWPSAGDWLKFSTHPR
jgi:hypothetical protein